MKVFAGQCRLISLGFRQGGLAGFGLRRQLVDERGQPKGELSIGEQKSIQTDRVILVPGPDAEVATVRDMYRMFVDHGRSEDAIAITLNHAGIQTDLGRLWTRGTVHQVLTNEKYVGNNLYNRTSFKLKRKRVSNTPDMWVRADDAFVPVIERGLFLRAQQLIADRTRRYSDEELLARLANLLGSVGHLSGLVIDERPDMPSSSAYRSRFGSLLRAYTLVGYNPGRDYEYVTVNRALRGMHPEIVTETVAAIERNGGSVRIDPATDLLTINDEFTASIVISRCLCLPSGAARWRIRLDTGLKPDISVVVRMDRGNTTVLDYYLLPRADMPLAAFRLREDNGLGLDGFRYDTLDGLYRLSGRQRIGRVA